MYTVEKYELKVELLMDDGEKFSIDESELRMCIRDHLLSKLPIGATSKINLKNSKHTPYEGKYCSIGD
jgi:hypothetical protein